MNSHKRPKLPLTDEERRQLRSVKIKLADIPMLDEEKLASVLQVDLKRAKFLKGMASFQQIPSIGEKFAYDLAHTLGYCRLDELKDEKWPEVFHRLELSYGCWIDPCVEDQVICVIHHANHPESDKQWFDFTEERKLYRKQHGYPASRPTESWFGSR